MAGENEQQQQQKQRYLVVFNAVSAGQNGPDLGSDEEKIVYLVYCFFDRQENKVRTHPHLLMVKRKTTQLYQKNKFYRSYISNSVLYPMQF